MMIRPIDALCLPGSPLRPNDDAYGLSRRVAVVLDGATGVGDGPLLPGKSDAQWVAIEAAAMLAGLADVTNGDVGKLIQKTVDHLLEVFGARRSREPHETYEIPYASLMLLAATNQRLEAGWYGDCRLLATGGRGSLVAAGPGVKARVREQDRARELARSHGTDAASTVSQASLARLRELRNRVNSREGTGLLGPDLRCVPLLKREVIDLDLPATALLMSDGFYALVTDYGIYDDRGLLAAAHARGLNELYRELRALESGDPERTRFPRYKTHDDVTAIFVEIY